MLVVISSNECQLLGLVYANIRTRIIIINEELFGLAVARVGIFILFLLSLTWCSGCSQSRVRGTYTQFSLLLFRNKHCTYGRCVSSEASAWCNITNRDRWKASEACIPCKASHSCRLWWLSDRSWGIYWHLRGNVLILTELRETLRAELWILILVKNSIIGVPWIVIRHFVLISKWLR